eukprot:4730454-Amphidinium_carterae.1
MSRVLWALILTTMVPGWTGTAATSAQRRKSLCSSQMLPPKETAANRRIVHMNAHRFPVGQH